MAQLDVLVAGATTPHGSAIARALLQGGHHVRALTANLAHPAAEALRLRGARLAWADIDDAPRLEDVARGAHALCAITESVPGDAGAETRHGLALAELARRLGISHVVYTSAPRAVRLTGEPPLDSRHEIEQYLRAAQIPHTIVCPAFFMENFLAGELLAGLREQQLRLTLPPGRRLQQLAHADHGRFVRIVLERRADFLGRRICIAADELTPLEIAATLARVLGKPVRYDEHHAAAHPQHDALRFGAGDSPDARAFIDELRRHYADVNWHSLEDWAAEQDWSML